MGALVTSQLGHKYAAELYGIHIGSGLTLSFFNGDRAWDFSGGRPIPDGLPADVHARIVTLDRRFAVHLAAHLLAPSTLAFGLSDSPAGMLAWILERWVKWSDNGGGIEKVFSKDELLMHATIYWVTNSIGITFVGYENPPGVSTSQRVQHFRDSDRAAWFNHVNLTVHDHGGHFIRGKSRICGWLTCAAPSAAGASRPHHH